MQNIPLNLGKDSWEIPGYHYMMAEFLPGTWLLTSWSCNAGQGEMALHDPGKQGRNLLPKRGDEGGLLCATAQSGTRVFGWGRELSELLLDAAFWRYDWFHPLCMSYLLLYFTTTVKCLTLDTARGNTKRYQRKCQVQKGPTALFFYFFFKSAIKIDPIPRPRIKTSLHGRKKVCC